VISLGFFYEYNSYIRDNWNKLDFAIVVFSVVDMTSGDSQTLGFIKVAKSLLDNKAFENSETLEIHQS
jgi:hypothetical protein